MTIASPELDPLGVMKFARVLHAKGHHERALRLEKQIAAQERRELHATHTAGKKPLPIPPGC